jgi:hypothetical protein
MPRKAKSYMRKWQPEVAVDEKLAKLAVAYGRFGLHVEACSKKVLQKGHGVLTGTLRRSIHTAEPGYDWSQDASAVTIKGKREKGASYTLGGKLVVAVVRERRVSLLVGSGLKYALKIHNGFGGFPGYHYLTLGLKKATPDLPKFLKEVADD